MPSNKETLFQDHICAFLKEKQGYSVLSTDDLNDNEFHFIEKHLIEFITATQPNKYAEIEKNYGKNLFAFKKEYRYHALTQ
jgi:type I restriction enzyme, R subunit